MMPLGRWSAASVLAVVMLGGAGCELIVGGGTPTDDAGVTGSSSSGGIAGAGGAGGSSSSSSASASSSTSSSTSTSSTSGSGGAGGSTSSAGTGGSMGAGGAGGSTGGSMGSGGAASTAASTSSSGSGGIACATPQDCPGADTECQARTCNAGTCGIGVMPSGTPVEAQTAGDCQKNVCDGAGAIITVADPTDPQDDGDDCTLDACNGTATMHTSAPLHTACNQNGGHYCDGNGACVECALDADCGATTACTSALCTAFHCWKSYVTAGAPTQTQTPGDCALQVCDGAGNVALTSLPSDAPPGGSCTSFATCAAGLDPTKQGGDLLWTKTVLAQCTLTPPMTLGGLVAGPTGDAAVYTSCGSTLGGSTMYYARLSGAGFLLTTASNGLHTFNGFVEITSRNDLARGHYYAFTTSASTNLFLSSTPPAGWSSSVSTLSPDQPASFSRPAFDAIGNIYTVATTTHADQLNAATTLPGPGTYLLRDGVSGSAQLASPPSTNYVPDGSGGVLIATPLAGAQALGCPIGSTTSPSYVARLDAAWHCTWATAVSTASPSLLADGSGGIVLATTSSSATDLGCGAQPAAAGGSTFVARLDPAGACAYATALAAPNLTAQLAPGGSVVVSGTVGATTVDLGGGSLAPIGAVDLVIAALGSTGNHVWSRRLGGAGLTLASPTVTAASTGNVYVQARYAGAIDFGGGPVAAAISDLAVASYTPAGAHRWSRALPIPGQAVVDGCGSLVAATTVNPAQPAGSSGTLPSFVISRYQP
ncbi:MAG: hypothetical protein QM820_37965 [Minicystis sp.]